jgi:hypothetical protein
MWLWEHKYNLQQGLAQHAYEEGHGVGCDDARILDTGSNRRYRIYKE